MTHVFFNEQEWRRYATYHQIPSARYLQSHLLERCSEELFARLQARFAAKDTWLRSAYIEVVLCVGKERFYLRCVHPGWQLSGWTRGGKWVSVQFPESELLSRLEQLATGMIQEGEQ